MSKTEALKFPQVKFSKCYVRQTYSMIEASRLGVVTEMPASNRPKLREVVLYFDSMPNAMLEVPIVAESNMSGDWFRPTEMDKAAFLKDCWNLRLS